MPPLLPATLVGLAGPFIEELVMRGVALARLRRPRLGAAGAALVVAAVWAARHGNRAPSTLALIDLDGLWLGAARVRSGLLLPAFALHAAGDRVSIAPSTLGGSAGSRLDGRMTSGDRGSRPRWRPSRRSLP